LNQKLYSTTDNKALFDLSSLGRPESDVSILKSSKIHHFPAIEKSPSKYQLNKEYYFISDTLVKSIKALTGIDQATMMNELFNYLINVGVSKEEIEELDEYTKLNSFNFFEWKVLKVVRISSKVTQVKFNSLKISIDSIEQLEQKFKMRKNSIKKDLEKLLTTPITKHKFDCLVEKYLNDYNLEIDSILEYVNVYIHYVFFDDDSYIPYE
jgi:hypothetical protein